MKIRSFLYIALMVILFPCCFSSCEFEMSDNGVLDGLWQMTEMQKTGEEAKDMRNTGTTWGFNFRLVELRSYTSTSSVLCRFEHKDGHLRIYEPRDQKHDESDVLITDATILNPFGLYTTSEDFQIEALTSSNLTIKSDKVRLKFRKY